MTDRRDALAWDRVGRFLQDGGSTASEIAQRHLSQWASVSDHLRKGRKYSANDMASDLATSLSTAMLDLDAIWSMLSGPRPGSHLARNLPSVFLLFRLKDDGSHALANAVEVEVDPGFRSNGLPKMAKIRLAARLCWPDPSVDNAGGAAQIKIADYRSLAEYAKQMANGIPPLRASLIARRRKKSSAYVVETVNYRLPKNTKEARIANAKGDTGALIPGLYDGLVYLSNPVLALADLRIVVEGSGEPDEDLYRPPTPSAP